jgi:hypothetical protein
MEGGVMLKEYLDFERDAGLLAEFEEVAKCYSASCVFADVQYRTGVMHSAIKAAFPAKAVGQALTVQLSKGDLVDSLKALEMGRPGDLDHRGNMEANPRHRGDVRVKGVNFAQGRAVSDLPGSRPHRGRRSAAARAKPTYGPERAERLVGLRQLGAGSVGRQVDARLVAGHMIANLMSLGQQAANQGPVARYVPANQEEGCLSPVAGKDVEDRRGGYRVWAIIDGQGHDQPIRLDVEQRLAVLVGI